jgi:hypothetical protein
VAIVKNAIVYVILILDLAVLAYLAGGAVPALVFLLFAAFFLLPGTVLAARSPLLRTMPPDLRIIAASVIVMFLAIPWFFARKALGMPLVTDAVTSLALTFAAIRFASPRALLDKVRPALRRLAVPVLIVLPIVFALIWLGFEVRAGAEVRYYGLLAIDLGNLASVVSTLRISPMLPQSFVAGAGGFSYHWLYFTLPAILADFLGATMPSTNALILTNLLTAALLFHTIITAVRWFNEQAGGRYATWAAAIVMFAPFTTYFYQVAATRFPIGWFALPTRNHLLLSPLNSAVTFGNNTFALVLALFVLIELERWNAEGRFGDAFLGTIALAMMAGYSITLIFSFGLALVVWTVLGRVRRPVVIIALAMLVGICVAGGFFAFGILTTGGSRHVAAAFDRGQFFRMVLFGLAPLWVVAALGGRRRVNIFHMLIVAAIIVPSMLYTAGSYGGAIDFSMKTGSLVAIAFAPLLAPALQRLFENGVSRWRAWAATFVIALGALQTAAYVLQFPSYRVRPPVGHAYAVPADYHDALIWIRDRTPRTAVVVDPQSLSTRDLLFTLMAAERRVWLPTPYTNEVLINASNVSERVSTWNAFAAGDADAGRRIAAEADYLVVRGRVDAISGWQLVRAGTWNVYALRPH